MAMRMSGLMSGMDTETIIQQLVEAKSVKLNTTKKAQTKHEWKQDAWSALNTKLKNLQSKYLSNMRFSSSYSKKVTKVSNSNIASVITGENAVNGVQTLEVEKLAKTAYLTSGKVADKDVNGKAVTALTKISDLDPDVVGKKLQLVKGKNGEKTVDIDITEKTTISDVLTQLKKAGLNASFDAKQQRFFIVAKESGESNDFSITGDDEVLAALSLKVNNDDDSDQSAHKVDGENAKIKLNGATFTSSTNVFEINGLTITALSESNGEKVTVTTEQDVDGIYDMVKNFLKEYNSIINEMDKLYNAESAKDYEPLTDEEKEAMSESEIEKYEQKIKDALFRHDNDLSSVSSALKEVMSSGVQVGGKTMYLFNFGIETLGYFSAPDNEKNAYHINGDPDDGDTSGNADVLRGMIATDPDTVISFFSKLSQNLYDKMSDMSKSVNGYRSFGNFYDDKKMKSDYDDYTTKIKELEKKLNDYEDKWYKKFSKMESAMAKMQQNASAITSLLGGGY